MKKSLSDPSVFSGQPASNAKKLKAVGEDFRPVVIMPYGHRAIGGRASQFEKLDPEFVAYTAFVGSVFVSIIAADTAGSHEMPFMHGGPRDGNARKFGLLQRIT